MFVIVKVAKHSIVVEIEAFSAVDADVVARPIWFAVALLRVAEDLTKPPPAAFELAHIGPDRRAVEGASAPEAAHYCQGIHEFRTLT